MKAVMIVFGLLAVFVVVTLWKAARHEARAEASHPPEGQFLEIDGHRVHALVQGDGPDLVLIHGASGNLRDFSFSLARKLAPEFRVVMFDRPGLGYSDRINQTGASIAQQADLLVRAAEQLGVTRPIVAGQSYGGAVALAWAVHHPDKIAALVPLAAASNPWDTGLSTYYRVLSHPLLGPLVSPLLTAWVPDAKVSQTLTQIFHPDAEPPGYDAHIGTGLTLRRGTLLANARQRKNLLGEIRALQPLYSEIRVPTEIVHGDSDATVPSWNHSDRLVAQIPGAVLTLLPGVGHMPHHAADLEVIAAIHRAAQRAGLR